MAQSNPNKLTYPVSQIVTRTASVQLNPTVNTSAYTANNTVGGLLTFPGIGLGHHTEWRSAKYSREC